MTKWICKACTMGDCSAENHGWTPECLYGHKDLMPNWERVEEPPIKDCPPFKQDDEHEPRVRAWLGDQHERDIQEMAGNLAALSDRVGTLEYPQAIPHNHGALIDAADALKERVQSLEYSEVNVVKRLGEYMERIEKLEHQMRDHYHCRHGGTAYLNRVGWGDVNKEYPE